MVRRAMKLAWDYHKGQKRSNGEMFISHPLWVMSWFTDPKQMQVAVMHDILECTKANWQTLEDKGFSEKVIRGVWGLTHSHGISDKEYLRLIRIIAQDPFINPIKQKDIQHNLMTMTPDKEHKIPLYKKSLVILKEAQKNITIK